MNEKDLNIILQNKGVIRSRKKLSSIITNAKSLLEIEKKEENFSKFILKFYENNQNTMNNYSYETNKSSFEISSKLSMELKKRNFKYVGPKICYSFMQAAGLISAHEINCFKYAYK